MLPDSLPASHVLPAAGRRMYSYTQKAVNEVREAEVATYLYVKNLAQRIHMRTDNVVKSSCVSDVLSPQDV